MRVVIGDVILGDIIQKNDGKYTFVSNLKMSYAAEVLENNKYNTENECYDAVSHLVPVVARGVIRTFRVQ